MGIDILGVDILGIDVIALLPHKIRIITYTSVMCYRKRKKAFLPISFLNL